MTEQVTRTLLTGICSDVPGARAAAVVRRADGRVLDVVRSDPDFHANGCRSAVAYGGLVYEQMAQAFRALELDAPSHADAVVDAGALVIRAVGGGHLAVIVRDRQRHGDLLAERVLDAREAELHDAIRARA